MHKDKLQTVCCRSRHLVWAGCALSGRGHQLQRPGGLRRATSPTSAEPRRRLGPCAHCTAASSQPGPRAPPGPRAGEPACWPSRAQPERVRACPAQRRRTLASPRRRSSPAAPRRVLARTGARAQSILYIDKKARNGKNKPKPVNRDSNPKILLQNFIAKFKP